MADDRPARRFFVLLLALTTLALALVVRPLASALFIAAVLAAMMAPLHVRMAARLRGRPRLAAGILVFALVVVLLGPFVGLAAFLITEGNEALKFVAAAVRSDSVAHLVAKLPDSLERSSARPSHACRTSTGWWKDSWARRAARRRPPCGAHYRRRAR